MVTLRPHPVAEHLVPPNEAVVTLVVHVARRVPHRGVVTIVMNVARTPLLLNPPPDGRKRRRKSAAIMKVCIWIVLNLLFREGSAQWIDCYDSAL